MTGDAQRHADEVARCLKLSLDVTAPAPPLRIKQIRDAKYYAERARILDLVGVERGIAFLREEALRALTHGQDSNLERWFQLHALEFGPVAANMVDLMGEAVRKLVTEDFADVVAEQGRAEHRHRGMGMTA